MAKTTRPRTSGQGKKPSPSAKSTSTTADAPEAEGPTGAKDTTAAASKADESTTTPPATDAAKPEAKDAGTETAAPKSKTFTKADAPFETPAKTAPTPKSDDKATSTPKAEDKPAAPTVATKDATTSAATTTESTATPTAPKTAPAQSAPIAGALPARDAATEANAKSEMIGPDKTRPRETSAFPMILGGIAAGAIGFLAAWLFLAPQDTGADADMIARIDALEAEIAALPAAPEAPDLQPLSDAQTDLDTRLGALTTGTTERADAIAATVADIESRLTAVERAPGADGAVTETAIASIEREIEALRAELAVQEARAQELTEEAAAALAAAEAQASAAETEAAALAQSTAARAAVAQVRVAIDLGEPFAEPLTDLAAAGVEVPQPLQASADEGVASLSSLQADFPDAARAALSQARSEEDAGGLGGFLSNQFQVRSVQPRDGDDADAVLSRAEAAVRDGRLADALTEIDALPETAAEPLAPWRAAAQARLDAVAAADTLDQSLNQ